MLRPSVSVFASLVLGGTLAAGVAVADAGDLVRLSVMRSPGSESCPTADELARDVRSRLQRDPFDPGATRSIEVSMTREPTGWVGRIYVRDRPDQLAAVRTLTLDSDDCRRGANAIGLAVALAIDPTATLAPVSQSSSAAPSASPSPAPSSPEHAVPTPTPSPATRPNLSADFGARLTAMWGPLPGLASALAIDGEIRPFRFVSFSWGALRSGEQRTEDARYGFTLTTLSASSCLEASSGRLRGSACLGLEIGVVTGIVYDFALQPVSPGDAPWAAFLGSLRAGVRIVGPLSIELGLEPSAALVRQRFVLTHGSSAAPTSTDTVFEQSPVGVSGWLALQLRAL